MKTIYTYILLPFIVFTLFTSCATTGTGDTLAGDITVTGLGITPLTLQVNHKVTVTLTVTSTDALSYLDVIVGLLEAPPENATDEELAALDSCGLGTIRFNNLIAEKATTLTKEFIVHSDCQDVGDGLTFNVFTQIDPYNEITEAQEDAEENNVTAFATYFLTNAKNQACTSTAGETGCVFSVTVDENPGLDLSFTDLIIQSSNIVLYDDTDHEDVPIEEDEYNSPHIRANAAVKMSGVAITGDNALTGDTEIRFDICPKSGANPTCSYGDWRPMTIHSVKDAASGHDRVEEVTSMTPGHNHYYTFDLYMEGDTLEAVQENGTWDDHSIFSLRGCINIARDAEAEFSLDAFTPLTEATGYGYGEDNDNNCQYIEFSVIDPRPEGNSPSLTYDTQYSNTWGSKSTMAVYADFGTDNTLDFTGAFTHTWADVELKGWIGATLLDVYAEAKANTSIEDSFVSFSISALDYTLYNYYKEVPSFDWEKDWDVDKSVCATFSYGIWIVSVDVEACASGTLGFEADFAIHAALDDDGNASGSAGPTLTPYLDFDGSATASVNALIAEAGVKADITILDARAPLSGTFSFEETDSTHIDVTGDIDFSTEITALNGYIEVYVKDKHVHCKHWYEPWSCHTYWHTVEEKKIVSWHGYSYDHTLLNRSSTETLEL
ncbi:MAG: hypothetical protein ABII18_11895 [bacterium]|nr:hypothetical protein [bacterium]